MTPEAQRIAIAEAWGFEPGTINQTSWLGYCTALHAETLYQLGCDAPDSGRDHPDHVRAKVPYFLGDLNAMHEAEKVLTPEQCETYHARLQATGKPCPPKSPGRWVFHCTAAQRAEAFLRCIGKWTPRP